MSVALVLRIALPILVGAIIGYATNSIAIWMLFRPLEPKYIGRFRVPGTPGVIPKERDRLAELLGEAVAENLMTHDDIAKLVSSIPYEKHLVDAVDEAIDRRVRGILPDSVTYPLKVAAAKAVLKEVKNLIEKAGPEMLESIDVAAAIREKLLSFEIEEIEALALRVAKRELRSIEIWGGIIGAVIGGVQAALGFVLKG